MKQTFLEFCDEVKGYSFHSKKTRHQTYKYQLYWNRLSPAKCFKLYDVKQIKHTSSYE